ncbi:MAG: phosphate signaling complex protein PhoU [Haloarculaceae archaeon]
MPRDEYQQALDDLRADVLGMGETVIDQFDRGLDAVETGDESLAREVIDGDAAVNDRYLALEGDCVDLLALQQPVAGDLRFVTASFKILTDLERVGDLATNLADYSLSAADRRLEPVDVATIGEVAREQLTAALEAYAEADAEAARAVAARDDDLDALCQRASERVVRDLIEDGAGTDAWAVERVMDDVSRVLLTVRDLERVGDHAVNTAARTLYMVESDPELI